MPKRDEPTLADKAQRIAEGTPTDAIHALLKRFMPDREVATRKVEQPFRILSRDEARAELGLPKMERQPRGFGTRRRTRTVTKAYKWVGYDTSRRGTFRHYMLSDIIKPYTDTASALRAHAESGQYADQTINFSWAAKEGYIEFI